jgi:hypothetical protein
VVQRPPCATRQREDPLGDASGAPTDVRVLLSVARGLYPEPFSHVGHRLLRRDLQPPFSEGAQAIALLAVEVERIAPPRVANEIALVLCVSAVEHKGAIPPSVICRMWLHARPFSAYFSLNSKVVAGSCTGLVSVL